MKLKFSNVKFLVLVKLFKSYTFILEGEDDEEASEIYIDFKAKEIYLR